jgi:phosphatidylglycerophosphate synthase
MMPERLISHIDTWASSQVKVPVAKIMRRVGLRATALNFVGFFGCVSASYLTAKGHLLGGGVVFFLFSALDAFDGTVARQQGTDKTFSLGAWLDAYLGTAAEAAVIFSLMFLAADASYLRLVAFVILLTLLVSHSKAVAGEYQIRPDWREVGALGRGIRIAILSAGLILTSLTHSIPRDGISVTLDVLIAFNAVVLCYRIAKIVAESRLNDRNDRNPKQSSNTR